MISLNVWCVVHDLIHAIFTMCDFIGPTSTQYLILSLIKYCTSVYTLSLHCNLFSMTNKSGLTFFPSIKYLSVCGNLTFKITSLLSSVKAVA